MRKNEDIRKAAKTAGVPLWEVADAVGWSEPTMTRRLRHELPPAEKKRLFGIIKQLAEVQ